MCGADIQLRHEPTFLGFFFFLSFFFLVKSEATWLRPAVWPHRLLEAKECFCCMTRPVDCRTTRSLEMEISAYLLRLYASLRLPLLTSRSTGNFPQETYRSLFSRTASCHRVALCSLPGPSLPNVGGGIFTQFCQGKATFPDLHLLPRAAVESSKCGGLHHNPDLTLSSPSPIP